VDHAHLGSAAEQRRVEILVELLERGRVEVQWFTVE
jgi:hypothetical protein